MPHLMAAVTVLLRQKFIILPLILTATSFCCNTGYAQNVPEQVQKALSCFNNKAISGCNQGFGLTQSGQILVPPEATDLFCNGPCLDQSNLILNCIDNVMSNFVFYNKATVGAVRTALKSGCSYSPQRGNFDVAKYLGEDTDSSTTGRTFTSSQFFALVLALITSWCLLWIL